MGCCHLIAAVAVFWDQRLWLLLAALVLGSVGSHMPGRWCYYSLIHRRWAMALGYHVDVEDHYFTTWLPDTFLAQEKEAGPRHLMERLEDLQAYLHGDLGRMIVIPRTQRQLRSKVIALGIVQDDLFEAEEACVLPVIRQQISEPQQFDMAQRLLLDRETQDAGWLLAWLTPHVTATERQWLADLVGHAASGPSYRQHGLG